MDDALWFEEEIGPAESTAQVAEAGLNRLDPAAYLAAASDETAGLAPLMAAMSGMSKGQRAAAAARYAHEQLRGIVRVFRPEVLALEPGTAGRGAEVLPYARGAAYLVRLRVEFDLSETLKAAHYRYKKLYCRAWLTVANAACAPIVLEVYPDRLFQGKPRLVKVELKPALAWHDVQGSLGSAATDMQMGVVTPATVGFLGDDQRAPYWEVTEKEEALLGPYSFWFVVDVPPGCDLNGIYLSVLAEGDLKFHLGPFPMGPARRQRQGTTRPRALGEMGGGRREE